MRQPTPAELIKIAGKPDYVSTPLSALTKTASLPQLYDTYAFKDRESTYLAYVNALIKQADADTMSVCEQYAKFWGIARDCARVKQAYDEYMQTPELDLNDYALVYPVHNTYIKKYAAYDSKSLIKSAQAFCNERMHYPFAVRRSTADRLLQKESQVNGILPDHLKFTLQKIACYGTLTKEGAAEAIICREDYVTPDNEELFENISSIIDHLLETNDRNLLIDACSKMDDFDHEAEVTCPPLEDYIVSIGEQEAQQADGIYMVELINGKIVDVRKIPTDALSVIDPELAMASKEELIEILPTLPRPDADRLYRMLASSDCGCA